MTGPAPAGDDGEHPSAAPPAAVPRTPPSDDALAPAPATSDDARRNRATGGEWLLARREALLRAARGGALSSPRPFNLDEDDALGAEIVRRIKAPRERRAPPTACRAAARAGGRRTWPAPLAPRNAR